MKSSSGILKLKHRIKSVFLLVSLPLVSIGLIGSCVYPSQYDGYYAGESVVHGSDRQVRPANGAKEVRQIAREVLARTNWTLSVDIYVDPSMGRRIANIQGSGNRATIRIGQNSLSEFPANTWAFILGHEFAHAMLSPHHIPGTSISEERRVDIAGAEFAVRAGYGIATQIGWMLTLRNDPSSLHGGYHDRAFQLADHFRMPEREFLHWKEFYSAQWPYILSSR